MIQVIPIIRCVPHALRLEHESGFPITGELNSEESRRSFVPQATRFWFWVFIFINPSKMVRRHENENSQRSSNYFLFQSGLRGVSTRRSGRRLESNDEARFHSTRRDSRCHLASRHLL